MQDKSFISKRFDKNEKEEIFRRVINFFWNLLKNRDFRRKRFSKLKC